MASILISFNQAESEYPVQLFEVINLIQKSRSKHRNIAQEDLKWEITWDERDTDSFFLQGSYDKLLKSSKLFSTPIEYIDYMEEVLHQEDLDNEEYENTLEQSLAKANQDFNGMWLKVKDRARGIICAYPILLGLKNSKGELFLITDNYLKSFDLLKLSKLNVLLMEENVDFKKISKDSQKNEKVKINKKTYSFLSTEEIKKITDYLVFIPVFKELHEIS